jgi:anthranilate synthase component 1
MFYLRFADRSVAGSSPEIWSACTGDRVTLRPIAGTRPRGATRGEDAALEIELKESEKDRAEHVMLVDLGTKRRGPDRGYRVGPNDGFLTLERYSHVMHLVSHVEGSSETGSAPSTSSGLLPAGTVSGIEEAGDGDHRVARDGPPRRVRRGDGIHDFHGNADFCITIRTAIIDGGRVRCGVGAGIVADSDPDEEWRETCSKAKAVEEAVRLAARGFET